MELFVSIIQLLEEWQPEIARNSIASLIDVITDQNNWEYFMSTQNLNRKQAW